MRGRGVRRLTCLQAPPGGAGGRRRRAAEQAAPAGPCKPMQGRAASPKSPRSWHTRKRVCSASNRDVRRMPTMSPQRRRSFSALHGRGGQAAQLSALRSSLPLASCAPWRHGAQPVCFSWLQASSWAQSQPTAAALRAGPPAPVPKQPSPPSPRRPTGVPNSALRAHTHGGAAHSRCCRTAKKRRGKVGRAHSPPETLGAQALISRHGAGVRHLQEPPEQRGVRAPLERGTAALLQPLTGMHSSRWRLGCERPKLHQHAPQDLWPAECGAPAAASWTGLAQPPPPRRDAPWCEGTLPTGMLAASSTYLVLGLAEPRCWAWRLPCPAMLGCGAASRWHPRGAIALTPWQRHPKTPLQNKRLYHTTAKSEKL